MAKKPTDRSGSNTQKCPQPNFEPMEVVKKAVELGAWDCFENKDGAKASENFENWLREFAGLWDSEAAFKADAPKVLEKWVKLLAAHAKTCPDKSMTLEEIADSIFAGKGFKGGGNLGGNPFFDVALLTAAASNQANAWKTFDAMFKDMLTAWAINWARKTLNRGPECLDIGDFVSWYDEFKSEIFIRKMDRNYRGLSGLRNYLWQPLADVLVAIAVRVFDLDGAGAVAGDDDIAPPPPTPSNSTTVATDGADRIVDPNADFSLDAEYNDRLFGETMRNAFLNMQPLRRKIFRLCYEAKSAGRSRAQIGEICGVSVDVVNANFYAARNSMIEVFANLNEEVKDELYQRLTDPACDAMERSVRTINLETGELDQ